MQQLPKKTHHLENKGHRCDRCFKTFPSSQQLSQHLLVHTNIRKYLCKYCDKAFKQLSHVQQHQRIHTGERPYKCTVESCSKAFRQLSSLQQHMKGHNILHFKSYPISKHNSSSPGSISSLSRLPSNLARPHDLTCQVCEKHCADEVRFFDHIQKYHADYWRVFSAGRPLSDFADSEPKRCDKPIRYTVYDKVRSHEDGYVKELAAAYEAPVPDEKMELFSCSVCDKFFTKEVYLLRHMEMKLDDLHCAGLRRLKDASPMFRGPASGLHPMDGFRRMADFATMSPHVVNGDSIDISPAGVTRHFSSRDQIAHRMPRLYDQSTDNSSAVLYTSRQGMMSGEKMKGGGPDSQSGFLMRSPQTISSNSLGSLVSETDSPVSGAMASASIPFSSDSKHHSNVRELEIAPQGLENSLKSSAHITVPIWIAPDIAPQGGYGKPYSPSPRTSIGPPDSNPSPDDDSIGCFLSPFDYRSRFQSRQTHPLSSGKSSRSFVHSPMVSFPYNLTYRSQS